MLPITLECLTGWSGPRGTTWGMGDSPGRDFFISYTQVNRPWAEWIAVQLEGAGYTTLLQAWDFRPGSDFVHEMQQATRTAGRTVAVLSPAYFGSRFSEVEWRAAFVKDPTGERGLLVPVRVQECAPPGLLASRVYIDLVDADEPTARLLLLAGVGEAGARPTTARFPGGPAETAAGAGRFPGQSPAVTEPPEPPLTTTTRLTTEAKEPAQPHPDKPAQPQPDKPRLSRWMLTAISVAVGIAIVLVVRVVTGSPVAGPSTSTVTTNNLVPAAATISVRNPEGIVADAGAVWVTNPSDDTVSRIDPAKNRVVATVKVGDEPRGIAVDAGAVWVTNSLFEATVSRIDPAKNRVVATVKVGDEPRGIAADAGAVWVTKGLVTLCLGLIRPTTAWSRLSRSATSRTE